MLQRCFATFVLAAAALLGCLLIAGPAAAGQGWDLYSSAGGYRPTISSAGYPISNASYGYPAAYRPVYAPTAGTPAARAASNTAFYYSPAAANPVADNRAHIRIALPADAEVRFDGDKTSQTGADRRFVSPPLQPGHEYGYEVTAQWKENGHEVTRDRRITVHAGDVVNVSFVEAEKAKSK